MLEQARDRGEETAHAFLVALQERADRSVYDAAAELLSRPDRRARMLALIILRGLGHPEARPVFPQTWELLEGLAQAESDPEVLARVLQCLAWTNHQRALGTLLQFTDHSDSTVRFAVADRLLACAPDLEDGPARRALLRLCDDPDPDVRWSALFEVKEHILDDTPETRDLLLRRQHDPSEDVRELAIEALLKRGRPPHPPDSPPAAAR